MSIQQALGSIALEMKEIARDGGDAEAAHSRADKLLLEAIQLLAWPDPRTRETAREISAWWVRVEKWYA